MHKLSGYLTITTHRLKKQPLSVKSSFYFILKYNLNFLNTKKILLHLYFLQKTLKNKLNKAKKTLRLYANIIN